MAKSGGVPSASRNGLSRSTGIWLGSTGAGERLGERREDEREPEPPRPGTEERAGSAGGQGDQCPLLGRGKSGEKLAQEMSYRRRAHDLANRAGGHGLTQQRAPLRARHLGREMGGDDEILHARTGETLGGRKISGEFRVDPPERVPRDLAEALRAFRGVVRSVASLRPRP